jgi:hypothetical protein
VILVGYGLISSRDFGDERTGFDADDLACTISSEILGSRG